VADARVDGQRDLISKLAARGEVLDWGTTDVELLLRSYRTWGENCVEHLLGDFAFAVWDGPRRRLFCARDHFGVRPFYYALLPRCLIFSNTLECIRQHPAVSDDLNETAIGDLLLFDLNQDPSTTFFSDVRCLSPAHLLTSSGTEVRLGRYWTLPFDEPARFRRSGDYVDQFRDLLRTVVDDRLRTKSISIYMSGGLDSTTVAATAQPLCDLRAYTVVYDRLIPDRERHYSGLAASALGIPIHYLTADDYRPFGGSDTAGHRFPEPDCNPLSSIGLDQLKQIGQRSRVALYCEGPDNLLLYEWRPYVRRLLTRFELRHLLVDVASFMISQRRLPLLKGIPHRFRRLIAGDSGLPFYPPWIKPEFASRLSLPDRWREWQRRPGSAHPIRPRASTSLELANWRYLFESVDAGITRLPVEVRHPFMDVRMVRYLLAVPPIPWCVGKYLLREAMKAVLPESVRRRPKVPLAGDPVSDYLRQNPRFWQTQPPFVPELRRYVDTDAVRGSIEPDYHRVWPNWTNLRPLSLNNWLRHVRKQGKAQKEKRDEVTSSRVQQEEVLPDSSCVCVRRHSRDYPKRQYGGWER
jgi:asparagine synthase (glutamine-hydrolysing)